MVSSAGLQSFDVFFSSDIMQVVLRQVETTAWSRDMSNMSKNTQPFKSLESYATKANSKPKGTLGQNGYNSILPCHVSRRFNN